MIKRLAFAPPRDEGSSLVRVTELDDAGAAPARARPFRAVACTALADLIADQAHAGVTIEWFTDADHLARYERWLAEQHDAPAGHVDVVVAEEHVLRGDAWLEQRWLDGGPRLKHMAIARRATGLTQSEFSARWQTRAGKVGATPIPDVAKGQAYAQDHPVPRPEGDWRYDAVNEVWFDDEDALRTRIAWMAETVGAGAEDDLVGSSAFLAVREAVVIAGA